MTELPDGWTVESLSDVASWGSGGTPQAGHPAFYGGDIPWAVIGDLNEATVVETRASITDAGLAASSAKLVPEGAVLLAMYGSIGKLGIAGRPMATNQAIAFALPNDRVLGKYLFYYLMSQRHQLDAEGKGATQRNISQTILRPWPIPLPEGLDEQHRIVDILEDHLSRLDAGVRGLGEAVEHLRLLRVSSLAHNVRSHEESGNGSLMFGDQALALAPDWASGCVAQAAELVEYGTSSKTHVGQLAGDVPVLRMGNVKDGRLVWASLKYLASDSPGLEKIMLRQGDLLFNRTNSAEHVGKSAVYEGEREAVTFASYLIRVRFRPEVDPRWANMVINSPYGRAYVTSVTSQQVGQANVNGTKLKAFPLPFPSLGEQITRIRLHSEVVDRADRMLVEVQTAAQRLQSLRRSLLDAAFAGRLTGRSSDMEMVKEMAGV